MTEVEMLKDRGSLMGGAIYSDGGHLTAVNVAMVSSFSPEGAFAYAQGGKVTFEEGYAAFPDGGTGFQMSRGSALSIHGLHGATQSRGLFGPRVMAQSPGMASMNDVDFVDLVPGRSFVQDNLGAWRRGEPDAELGLLVDTLGNGLGEAALYDSPLDYGATSLDITDGQVDVD